MMACMAVFTLVLVVGVKWTQSRRMEGYAQIEDDVAARRWAEQGCYEFGVKRKIRNAWVSFLPLTGCSSFHLHLHLIFGARSRLQKD